MDFANIVVPVEDQITRAQAYTTAVATFIARLGYVAIPTHVLLSDKPGAVVLADVGLIVLSVLCAYFAVRSSVTACLLSGRAIRQRSILLGAAFATLIVIAMIVYDTPSLITTLTALVR